MKRNEISHRVGFTLLELIIVVAIVAVMAGVAVPYYQDYLFDTRVNANKTSMANFRRVLEDFKGDHGRGPYRGKVYRGGAAFTLFDCTFSSNSTNELIAGVVPPLSVSYTERRHKYINSLPVLEDPLTGERLPLQFEATASLYFCDLAVGGAHAGEFDLGNDGYYKNMNPSTKNYNPNSCEIQSGSAVFFSNAVGTFPADVIAVYATDSRGIRY